MSKRIVYFLLLLLLIADSGYSFMQFLGQPLDGDMAESLIPSDFVKPVLENPLGVKAILENRTYANPNRFFCHWIYREYLLSMPFLLQRFTEPVDSVYLACALSKIIIQLLLIILLSMAITGSTNILRTDFIAAAVLMAPLFQTNGYRSYMGIIDPSTTYTFFYALPCAILLLYLMPLIIRFYHGKGTGTPLFIKILWIPLAFVVCLSGPLNPGIVLIFSALVILTFFLKKYRISDQEGILKRIPEAISGIPGSYWFFLVPASLLALYSLCLGRYNLNTIAARISTAEMYLRIPEGIYYQFTQKLGFPVLFIILVLNTVIIFKKYKDPEGKKIMNIFKWIGIFALCYILLLPLGGYRMYRPHILRYDTIMPITLSLFFVFGISTLFLIKNFSLRQKIWYLPLIVVVLFIFTNADEPKFDRNQCERSALRTIAESKEKVVALHQDCSVVGWRKTDQPENSELNAQLLMLWRITKEKRYYYNK